MAANQGLLSFTMRDYSREEKSFSVRTGVVTGGTLPGLTGQIGPLKAAIEGITNGVLAKEALSAWNSPISGAAPTDPLAQIEHNWLVTFEDNQQFFDAPTNSITNEGYGKLFNVTIPTAEITATRLKPNSADEADLTEAGMAAFITAFEAVARSPYGGTVNVVKVRYVGRNV